jgi:hypothetical protein
MSDLRSLIEAAKTDAPTAAARTKVWAGVSSVIGEAAAATGAASLAGSASAAKMLVLGTLLGGALTVGVGAALLFVGAVPPLHDTVGVAARAPASRSARGAESTSILESNEAPRSTWLAGPASLSIAAPSSPSIAAPSSPSIAAPSSPSIAAPSSPSIAAPPVTTALSGHAHATRTNHAASAQAPAASPSGDALAREASLLEDARSALGRGDGSSALQMVRRLRALPAGQLVPEELAVEAQALRALGLNDDANEVDATLRTRFPDSALGR